MRERAYKVAAESRDLPAASGERLGTALNRAPCQQRAGSATARVVNHMASAAAQKAKSEQCS
jgi:hypothetical protein